MRTKDESLSQFQHDCWCWFELQYTVWTFDLKWTICVLLLAASVQITWQDSSASLEEKLFKSLFGTNAVYQTHRNGNGPLLVNITVMMSNVLNVDILKYTITSVLVLNQSWYNKRLAWDEQEFPFSTITVPWNSVWTPSYTVQEAFDVTWRVESPNVVLHNDGKTEFQLALRIDSNCNFDLFYYPLDSSQCFLSFFSLNSKGECDITGYEGTMYPYG
ncbi:ZACN: Zinc-activated ligand-gated ion channel [Crotalus adamanteus]|uniref:ZACN: Zinc-activated ligand-gated ion channel n=1 Tax=Crotalus adamanteus TaxID=8729 RepID=A0AAW1BYE1_CROAD